MTILPYITIESWLTIISLAIALIVYLFRIDRKVIFYFARRKIIYLISKQIKDRH